jgi:hypothetical protein
MVNQQAEKAPSAGQQLLNGAKLVTNLLVVPGVGQIMEGKVGSALIYGGAGVLARSVLGGILGPVSWIAIGLDSYSVSSSGKHLWELTHTDEGQVKPASAKPPE